MASDTMLGWWFAPSSLWLPYGDGRSVVVGETLIVEPPLTMCQHGLLGLVLPLVLLLVARN